MKEKNLTSEERKELANYFGPDYGKDDEWANLFFEEYQSLDGQHDRERFIVNCAKFFKLTQAAYVDGIGDRKEAYNQWVEFIGDREEADKYFESVDNISSYS